MKLMQIQMTLRSRLRAILTTGLFAPMLILTGCETLKTELRVIPHSADVKNLTFQSEKGALELVPGIYSVEIKVSTDPKKPSQVIFQGKNKTSHAVAIHLPEVQELSNRLEAIEISSTELGQPVDLTLTRDTTAGQDRIGITLTDPKTGNLLAVSQIYFHSDETNYEGKTAQFLRSYQRVKLSERGIYIPVESTLNDGYFLSQIDDQWVNTSVQVLIAPWIYSRYNQVEWRIGSHDQQNEEAQKERRTAWSKLIETSPVIDYFAFLSSGSSLIEAEPLYYLPKNKNQLRFVYTEGTQADSGQSLITLFNAGFSAAHRETSESLQSGTFGHFGFTLTRSWTLGMSALTGLRRAYIESKILGISPWSDNSEMSLTSFSWTSELPLEKTGISFSATPARETKEKTEIYQAKISNYIGASSKQTQFLSDETAPENFGYDICSLKRTLTEHAFEDRRNIEYGDYSIESELRHAQLIRYQHQLDAKACD